jgi:K+-transporting ATPase ATPase C chain
MNGHVRANLWLLGLTLGACCVLYPLALWVVGRVAFPSAADGSLIKDGERVRGSRLIGQPFSDAKYFQPRPSATAVTAYNAAASGGSNYAASNPKLRGRVAQALGLIARYRKDGPEKGRPVGPDVEAWFQEQVKEKRDLTGEWAKDNPSLVTEWAKSSDPIKAYVKQWAKDHPEVLADFKEDNPSAGDDPEPEDLAPYFFKSYVKAHPGTWPSTVEVEKAGKKVKEVRPATAGDDVRSIFFDTWLREMAGAKRIDPLKDLEQVPADLVMASGSGLDPHITLRGAEYQLDNVVEARAKEILERSPEQAPERVREQVREAVKAILKEHAFTPLSGLVGEPLVNVLEVNRALDAEPEPQALVGGHRR